LPVTAKPGVPFSTRTQPDPLAAGLPVDTGEDNEHLGLDLG
jgi:hypothetical protein